MRRISQTLFGRLALGLAFATSLCASASAIAGDLPPPPAVALPPPAPVAPAPVFKDPLPYQAARPGPWAITGLVGFSSRTNFSQIVFHPWSGIEFERTHFYGGTISARLFSFWEDFTVEAELGGGILTGVSEATELWHAYYVRFDGFPWNHIIYTTFAGSVGLSYRSSIPLFERQVIAKYSGSPSKVLHYFSPEITLAHPDHKDFALVLRLHHRSGVFGLINDITDASNVLTVGLRKHFAF